MRCPFLVQLLLSDVGIINCYFFGMIGTVP